MSSGHIGQTEGEFSVCQFFENDTWEYTRRRVSSAEAAEAFKHYCTSVAARTGLTKRVIITDSGDNTNFEWVYGEGVIFPPELKGSLK